MTLEVGLRKNQLNYARDIFQIQDVPQLEKYIQKHINEFRHVYCNPFQHVSHAIHDQTVYLTVEHKRKLKEEFGIGPWIFVQSLVMFSFLQVVLIW